MTQGTRTMRKALSIAALGALVTLPALLAAQLPAGPFDGPALWTDPVPGNWLIRVKGTNLCVARASGAIRAQLPHLVLEPCNAVVGEQWLELVPNGTTSTPLDGASTVTWRIMSRQKCLTAARGVLFGAPAVDEVDCGSRDGIPAMSSRMGAADQTWRLQFRPDAANPGAVGPRPFVQIRLADGRCWSAQGRDLRAGVQLVMDPCADQVGQQFEVVNRQTGVMTEPNQTAIAEFGWTGLPQPRGFQLSHFRAMPRLNLPSGDYTQGLATANDQGLACAQACADDASCKGFTWVDPRARGGQAMCYKKDTLNQPVADNFSNSGIVRPR